MELRIKSLVLTGVIFLYTQVACADINYYMSNLYKSYKEKENQCLVEGVGNKLSLEEKSILEDVDPKVINAYAIKKGIEHKIECTSKELVQFFHAGWAAHRASQYDEAVSSVSQLMDSIVDTRYLDAIIYLGGVSNETIKKLDSIEYFHSPFDFESRPWENLNDEDK